MTKLANFMLYQAAWFAAVEGAARGMIWLGPAAMVVVIVVHLVIVSERARELRFLLIVGFLGTIADSGLAAVGALAYPTSQAAWSSIVVPPWISALWIGFATLPRFSLAWLAQRPWLAALLGAIGGPLSFLAGVRMGAIAAGPTPMLTWSLLPLEYALATPLLICFAPKPDRSIIRDTTTRQEF